MERVINEVCSIIDDRSSKKIKRLHLVYTFPPNSFAVPGPKVNTPHHVDTYIPGITPVPNFTQPWFVNFKKYRNSHHFLTPLPTVYRSSAAYNDINKYIIIKDIKVNKYPLNKSTCPIVNRILSELNCSRKGYNNFQHLYVLTRRIGSDLVFGHTISEAVDKIKKIVCCQNNRHLLRSVPYYSKQEKRIVRCKISSIISREEFKQIKQQILNPKVNQKQRSYIAKYKYEQPVYQSGSISIVHFFN